MKNMFVSSELSNYINYSINKSLEKYKNNVIPYEKDQPYTPDNLIILPFVSFISFLAGYYFCRIKRLTS
jgi:hypothetical protein